MRTRHWYWLREDQMLVLLLFAPVLLAIAVAALGGLVGLLAGGYAP